MFSLSKTKFEQKIKSGEDFIIYKKVKNFNNDPHKSFINIVEKNKYSFIYESVEGGINRGRYTICGFDPLIILKINNKKASLYKKKKNKLIQVRCKSHQIQQKLPHPSLLRQTTILLRED